MKHSKFLSVSVINGCDLTLSTKLKKRNHIVVDDRNFELIKQLGMQFGIGVTDTVNDIVTQVLQKVIECRCSPTTGQLFEGPTRVGEIQSTTRQANRNSD